MAGTPQDVGAELEMDSVALSAIVGKALSAARAAEAAKKARDLVRRKSVLTKSTLPGKLSDCTSTDLAQSEIFLVEGDSAGARAPHPAPPPPPPPPPLPPPLAGQGSERPPVCGAGGCHGFQPVKVHLAF